MNEKVSDALVEFLSTGAAFFLLTFALWFFWNLSIPQVFGLPKITYWQTWQLSAIVVLVTSLVKLQLWGQRNRT